MNRTLAALILLVVASGASAQVSNQSAYRRHGWPQMNMSRAAVAAFLEGTHETTSIVADLDQDPLTNTATSGPDTLRYSMALIGGLLHFELMRNPNAHKRGKHDIGENAYLQDPLTNTATSGPDTLRYSHAQNSVLSALSLVSQGGQDNVLTWE